MQFEQRRAKQTMIEEVVLEFVAIEDLVLVAARAIGALETANEKNSHSQCDQDGEHARVRFDPMK